MRLREVAHFSRAPSSEENTGTANERSQAEGGARPKIDTVGWNTKSFQKVRLVFVSVLFLDRGFLLHIQWSQNVGLTQ